MLRLLLCLFSAHLLSVEGLVTLDGPKTLNIEECPITFYGVTHETLYVRFSEDNTQNYCFGKEGDRSQKTAGDCIIIPAATTAPTYELTKDLSALSGEISTIKRSGSGVEDAGEPDCALVMRMRHKADTLLLVVRFGRKAAVYFEVTLVQTAAFIITVNGQDKDINKMPANQPRSNGYSLIGCRLEDEAIFRKQSSGRLTEECLRRHCTEDGEAEDRPACKSGEICKDRMCVVVKTCAVAGRSIIDNLGQTAPIEKFCGYKLLKGLFFDLSATFAERRLGDVPLLDKLKITTNAGTVNLHQGGVVMEEGGDPITLTEEATNIKGLVVTKVKGGVSVVFEVPIFKPVFEMFFDGTTLHVTQTSSSTFSTTGMCTDITKETPQLSALISCDAPKEDSRGDGIDCDAVKERCEKLLSAAPFDKCSVDRAPYVKACSALLCNYPDADGLYCHLLDAYARSCQLQDWRETAGCSVSQCYFRKCVYDNEFCGLSVEGDPGCFCRSSYAAPYRAKKSLGADETLCSDRSASVSLVGCLLEEEGVDVSSLTLNSPQCKGVQDAKTNKISFSFSHEDDCGATRKVDGSKIVYSNTISSPGGSQGLISRQNQFSVDFSCSYVQPEAQTLSIKIQDRSVEKVMDSGDWTYVFKMEAFTDSALTKAVEADSQLVLDQPLWVRVQALEVDEVHLSLVLEQCWATKENKADAEEKYQLIQDGCSVEEGTAVVSNGAALSSVFSFRVFQFVNSEADVFLHCQAKLCLTSTGCTKTC